MSSSRSSRRRKARTEIVVVHPEPVSPPSALPSENADELLSHFDESLGRNSFFCPSQFLLWDGRFTPPTDTCKHGFQTPTQRRKHVEDVHSDWLDYFKDSITGKYHHCCVNGCNVINAPSYIDHFLRHLDEKHNPEHKPNFTCPLCNGHFARRNNLQQHMGNIHGCSFSRKPHGPKPRATIINRASSASNTFVDSGMGHSYSSRRSAPQFSSYESTAASSPSLTESFTASPDTPFAKALQSIPRLGSRERWDLEKQRPWNHEYQRRPLVETQVIQGSQAADHSGLAVPPQTATQIESEGNSLAVSSPSYPMAISQQQHQHVRSNYSMPSQTQIQAIGNTQQTQLAAEILFLDLTRRSLERTISETSAIPIPRGGEDHYKRTFMNLALYGLADLLGFSIQDMQPPS